MIVDLDYGPLWRFFALSSSVSDCQRQPKELLENQSPVSGRSEPIVFIDRGILSREMKLVQRGSSRYQRIALSEIFRQVFRHRAKIDVLQYVVNDFPQSLTGKFT